MVQVEDANEIQYRKGFSSQGQGIMDIELKATRDGFGTGIIAAAEANGNVVALCADLTDSCRLTKFREQFPDRFIECGVAEQNMIGMAAGLALSGKIPFTCSFAVFSPGRTWDQIRVSVCYTQANVKIMGHHTGLTVGEDGATHQALEDIALMRVLPNMTVLVPCDANEAKQATIAAAQHQGPVYIRFNREKSPLLTSPTEPFTIGKARIIKEGSDVSIIACGLMVAESLQAVELLQAQNISCEVINCSSIKPLDAETILQSVSKTNRAVTVEEHQVAGGLGGAIAELLSEKHPTRLVRIGMPDKFGESGQARALLEKYELTAIHIVQKVQEAYG